MGFEGERMGLLGLWAVAAWGLITAVLSAPPAAALVGAVYRFPIPFGDHAQGVGELGNAAMASVFYLVKGEGFVLAALGAGAGYLIARTVGPALLRALSLSILAAFGIALLAALVLAAL